MLFIGARYVVFTTIIKFQKTELRESILKEDFKNSIQIKVLAQDLYQNVNGIEWKENNKEIVVKNKYYEVITVEKNGDFYVLNVIEDKQENNLFSKFFDMQESNDDSTEYDFSDLEFNFLLPTIQLHTFQKCNIINHYTHYICNFSTDFQSRIEKPPIV